jgi:hypothetical protein
VLTWRPTFSKSRNLESPSAASSLGAGMSLAHNSASTKCSVRVPWDMFTRSVERCSVHRYHSSYEQNARLRSKHAFFALANHSPPGADTPSGVSVELEILRNAESVPANTAIRAVMRMRGRGRFEGTREDFQATWSLLINGLGSGFDPVRTNTILPQVRPGGAASL